MSDLSLVSRVKISSDVLFQDLNGEAVLLDLKSGVYFGLDRVGSRVWQLLGEHEMLSGVVEAMVNQYDVTEQRCTEDLLALIAQLNEQGLLIVE